MLVQATDGRFYVNPVLYGEKSLADFRQERPRVVVAGKIQPKTARTRAGQALLAMGINGRLQEGTADKLLINGSLTDGWIFDFRLRAAIPVPTEFVARVEEPPLGEICSGFWFSFWETEVVDHIWGRCRLPLLQRALLGEWLEDDESRLRRRLYRQHPTLRNKKRGHAVRVKIIWCPEVTNEEVSLD